MRRAYSKILNQEMFEQTQVELGDFKSFSVMMGLERIGDFEKKYA